MTDIRDIILPDDERAVFDTWDYDHRVSTIESPCVFHYAICRGLRETVRILIPYHDVNGSGGLPVPFLYAAVWRDHPEIVQMLLEAGANPLMIVHKFPIVFHAKSKAVARSLVDRGADIISEVDGEKPIHHFSSSSNRMGAIEVALEEGEDINVPEKSYGHSPLHLAKSKKMAKFLLDRGASRDVKNNKGMTPAEAFDNVLDQRYNEIGTFIREYQDEFPDTKGAITEDL